MPTITLHDETTAGTTAATPLTLHLLSESISVRELIRSRVYQEVDDFNRKQRTNAQTLPRPRPTHAERKLNGQYKLKSPRQIDWKAQFEKAYDTFEQNCILNLIDKQQAPDIDRSSGSTPPPASPSSNLGPSEVPLLQENFVT
jgi:hypothetical protein